MPQMRWYPVAGGSASLTENRTHVASMKDCVTGEEVVYQYDALQRLASATTVGPEWGLSWSYDGFGNRLTQAVTKGSAPVQNILVDASTNRVQSWSYDANGNATSIPGTGTLTYDVLNRVKTVSGESYEYGPGNLRTWRGNVFVLWGASGERVGEYSLVSYSGTMGWQQLKSDVYFAGRRLQVTDRLGSVRSEGGAVKSYFPYGEERTSTANGADKFGTYYRDNSGLDYAQQRYYVPASGRFSSPDPIGEGTNHFRYSIADPVSLSDPSGLATCFPNTWVYSNSTWFVQGTCESEGGTIGRQSNFIPTRGLPITFRSETDPYYRSAVQALLDSTGAEIDREEEETTAGVLSYYANVFANISFSNSCSSWVAATLQRDVSFFQQAAAQIRWVSGFGGEARATSIAQLYVGVLGDRAFTLPGLRGSVAARFRSDRGIAAMAELRGSRVFASPHLAFVDPELLMATIFHETIHVVLGWVDDEIQRAFRIPVSSNTFNITAEIRRQCF